MTDKTNLGLAQTYAHNGACNTAAAYATVSIAESLARIADSLESLDHRVREFTDFPISVRTGG